MKLLRDPIILIAILTPAIHYGVNTRWPAAFIIAMVVTFFGFALVDYRRDMRHAAERRRKARQRYGGRR